jgi:hypothetical protein
VEGSRPLYAFSVIFASTNCFAVRVCAHLIDRVLRGQSRWSPRWPVLPLPAAPDAWTHIDPGRLEVSARCFAPHPGDFLDPPQGPFQQSQCNDLLFLFVAQYIVHTGAGYKASRRRQRPERLFSSAGFQVTFIGWSWVTPEGRKAISVILKPSSSKTQSNDKHNHLFSFCD